MNTFRHAGDRGDIIASLPAVRALGGGLFLIEAATYTRETLTPDKWCGLEKILKAQPYITDVREWPRHTNVTYNLNDFRSRLFKSVRMGVFKDKSLVDWHLEQFGLNANEKDKAWLTIEPKATVRVLFSRSGAGRSRHHVYHNPRFPWHYVWSKYHKEAAFIGLPEEHNVFCGTCGRVDRIDTKDLYEAARVISGCDLFIGNQSALFWLAEGMKKRLVLEVWPDGPNSNVFRHGAIQGYDENVSLPDL